MRATVSGRIQTGSYTDRDGKKVYTTEVVVEEQEFAESKSAHSGNPRRNEPQPHVSDDGFMNIPDDYEGEMPFN